MKKILSILSLFLTLVVAENINECIVCHEGVADIRERSSGMMQAILVKADEAGAKGNDCVVCHGGNPSSKVKEEAHKGTLKYFVDNKGPKAFYPYPASPWINENTCGMCHPKQVLAQENNL
ncbi:MAG: cytochrome C, partial [Epsilonproteobacteria bacterium]